MDRAAALAVLNGKILQAFSARTVNALRAAAPLRVALPYIEPVLALNVAKEIRKDALVIRRGVESAATGERAGADAVPELFAATRAIDEDFLAHTKGLPVRLVIKYEEIGPVRTMRIRYVLDAAHRISTRWQRPGRLRDALRAAYAPDDFEMTMCMILELYGRETRALSRSVQLPAMLAPIRERAAKHLSLVMSEAATRLATDLARGLYRR
ncbi:MAG: hypothetical protein ACXW2A_06130 [Burkholderiales bacterium]